MITTSVKVKIDFDPNKLKGKALAAFVLGIQDGAEHVLQTANDYVPLDEGTLLASGNVKMDHTNIKAKVGYDTKYAAWLHENPQFNFQNNRQGKYLEKGLERTESSIENYVANKMKKYL